MPRIVVDEPIPELSDRVRLTNWSLDRYKDLKAMCEIHKGVTERIYSENGQKARNLSWHELWDMIFDKKYKEHHGDE